MSKENDLFKKILKEAQEETEQSTTTTDNGSDTSSEKTTQTKETSEEENTQTPEVPEETEEEVPSEENPQATADQIDDKSNSEEPEEETDVEPVSDLSNYLKIEYLNKFNEIRSKLTQVQQTINRLNRENTGDTPFALLINDEISTTMSQIDRLLTGRINSISSDNLQVIFDQLSERSRLLMNLISKYLKTVNTDENE